MDDRLADRVKPQEKGNNVYKLDILHCSETDSGIYTAKATNGTESSTCTAQLVVQECKKEISFLEPQIKFDSFFFQ